MNCSLLMRLFMLAVLLLCKTTHASRVVNFYSEKAWKAGRWYLVAELKQNSLQWWGSGSLAASPLKPNCRFKELNTFFSRKNKDLEVLASASLVMIEVDPMNLEDVLYVQAAESKGCSQAIPLEFNFSEASSRLKPYLFLTSKDTVYKNTRFIIHAPEVSEGADIQLDLLLGYWHFQSNKAQSSANSQLHLLPALIARGEWRPSFINHHFGLMLQLEQSLSSRGGTQYQSLSISDLVLGMFLETVVPVLDGLQLRFSGKAYQHLADDGKRVSTIDSQTEFMFIPVMSASSTLYFAKRYFVGLGLDYGIPNEVVLGAIGQSYLGLESKFGIRLTKETFWLLEANAKRFSAESGQQDRLFQFNTGIRIEF